VGLGLLVAGIVGSNPALGLDVCCVVLYDWKNGKTNRKREIKKERKTKGKSGQVKKKSEKIK
jgi:hypothetical protein